MKMTARKATIEVHQKIWSLAIAFQHAGVSDYKDLEQLTHLLFKTSAEVFQQQISHIEDKAILLKLAKALRLAPKVHNLVRWNSYDGSIDRLNFNQFKRLLSEVEDRINFVNQHETNIEQDTTGLLSEAHKDLINEINLTLRAMEGWES